MNMRELLAKRSSVAQEMRSIVEKPEGSNGDLSEAQEVRFSSLKAEIEKLEKSIERQSLIDETERRMHGTPLTAEHGKDFERELRNYSLLRVIAGQCQDLNVDWGREREIGQELQRRSGRQAQGIMVPMEVFETRVTTTTAPAAGPGGLLVPTDHLAGQYIDRLRAKLVTARLGARVLSGLHGNVDIPGLKASATSGWVAENQALTFSDLAFRKVSLIPKHAGAITELSRNMLQQTSPEIEALVRDDFASILAGAVDSAALEGGGTNEPTGILSHAGLQKDIFDEDEAWASIQDFIGSVENRNVDSEGCAFVAAPSVVTLFRKTLRTPESFIMENRNTLDGFPVARTTICPAMTLIFGNWSDLLIGYWSAFDLLVNPYESTAYAKGNVQVRAMLTCDVAVRHIESFGALKNVSA